MSWLNQLYDKNTGNFYIPKPIIPDEWRAYSNNLFPEFKRLEETYAQRSFNLEPNSKLRLGQLDSGIMTQHPWIKNNKLIKAIKDFTGEGIEDQNGHGTVILLQTLFYIPNDIRPEIFVGKVLDANKKSYEHEVINGVIWAAQNEVDFLNLSAGIERDKKCDGNCEFCKTLRYISKENDMVITTSAGNNIKKFYCPAILDGHHSHIVATDSFSNYSLKRTRVVGPESFQFIKI